MINKHYMIFSIFILLVSLSIIHYSPRAQENKVIIYVLDDVGSEAVADFILQIENSLIEYDISIEIINRDSYYLFNDAIASIQFIETFGGDETQILITLSAISHHLNRISPILSNDITTTTWLSDVEAQTVVTGIILYSVGEFSDSENLLNAVQNANGEAGNIPFYLGNLKILQGDLVSAITFYKQRHNRYFANLAWAYYQLGKSEESFSLLTDLLESYQENVIQYSRIEISILWIRAQLYALSLDYDSAIADIDEAVAIAEENELSNEILAELYTIRGEIIFLIYEWDRVEDNFDLAIDLNPQYARAYFQRGVLFYTMARREDALADFQTYLDLEADGLYAEEAQSYIESIEIELEALGG